MVDIRPQPLLKCKPFFPFATTQPRFGLGNTPRRCHQQRKSEISSGVVEHTRGVGCHHTAFAGFGNVDVVVTDGNIRHHFHGRTGIKKSRVDFFGQATHHPHTTRRNDLNQQSPFTRLLSAFYSHHC